MHPPISADCIDKRVPHILQTGGLLSDVLLHLVPHSFMGEHQGDGAHFVMVEEKRNIIVGYVVASCVRQTRTSHEYMIGLVSSPALPRSS